MSLRLKIVLILTLVVGVFAAVTDRVQRTIFLDRFEELERLEAEKNLERVIEALQGEISRVDEIARQWSAWDDAYAYVRNERRTQFERSNLAAPRLAAAGIDLLFFLGAEESGQHEVLWNDITDPDTGVAVRLRDFPTQSFRTSHPLLAKVDWGRKRELERRDTDGGGVLAPSELDLESIRERERERERIERPVGILLTEYKPLIISARPILPSRPGAEAAGVLILGRFLSASLESELAASTKVDFDFWQADGRHELPTTVQQAHREAASTPEPVRRVVGDSMLHVYGAFPDFRNRPELLLRANVDRNVTATGNTAVAFGLVSTVAAGFLLLLVLMSLLQRVVLTPLFALTSHAKRIGAEEDFRAKLDSQRSDELGVLADEFDCMMAKLESARAQVVETARTAGMSEIATGILHNVGNVLNSVNISASLVTQRIEGMAISDLQMVAEILDKHKANLGEFIDNDPKGKHLQPFLTALSVQLGEEQRTIKAEVGSLTEGIEHICELIKSQQNFAVKACLVEPLDPAEKVDEALRLSEQAAALDPNLEVVREFEEVPEIQVDKHRLLEILVNLIQNARQATDQGGGVKRITLRVRRQGEDQVRIEVEDTGVGVPEENLARIFNLGFTTKEDGHGYGLHTAANAATEMGGRLYATSPGPGEGATFTLELPLETVTTQGAAR